MEVKELKRNRGFKVRYSVSEFKAATEFLRSVKAKYSEKGLIDLGYSKGTVHGWYQRGSLPNPFNVQKLKKLMEGQ